MRSAFKEDLYNLECTEQIRLARSTKDKWQFSHAEAKWKKVQKRESHKMLLLPWNRFVTTMVVTFEAADQSVLTNHTSVRLMASVFNVITAQGCIIIRDFQSHRQSCSSDIFLGLYHSFYIDATSICCGALARMCVFVCVCVYACACVRACMHTCVLAHVCMYALSAGVDVYVYIRSSRSTLLEMARTISIAIRCSSLVSNEAALVSQSHVLT